MVADNNNNNNGKKAHETKPNRTKRNVGKTFSAPATETDWKILL